MRWVVVFEGEMMVMVMFGVGEGGIWTLGEVLGDVIWG